MAKKSKINKRPYEVSRNWIAVAAHFATGAGKHSDKRSRRRRTRASQNKAAFAEYA